MESMKPMDSPQGLNKKPIIIVGVIVIFTLGLMIGMVAGRHTRSPCSFVEKNAAPIAMNGHGYSAKDL